MTKFIPCIEARISDRKAVKCVDRFMDTEYTAEQFIGGLFKSLVDVAQERFILLCFNVKNDLLSYSIISQGTLTSALIHPREVLKHAILSNAASVIFIHNHPSGDPNPSMDDIEITNLLSKAFKICGITILDHIIVADKDYWSFRHHNMI